jgi:mersacidin/lichenicidin family type 2 lantibiotic
MREIDHIIRAWKDDDYRLSLSLEEQRALPPNPAGGIELLNAAPERTPVDPYSLCTMTMSIRILTFCF